MRHAINAERPDAAGEQPEPPKGNSLASEAPCNAAPLRKQYLAARARLDSTLDLLDWALDVRLALRCGIDLEDAAGAVEQLRRKVVAHLFARHR